MALPPSVYGRLLMEKILKHGARCWLVNTGWTGKPYGEGERIQIAHSRAIVRNILEGRLEEADVSPDPLFRFLVPRACPDVPPDILNPRAAAGDKDGFEKRAKKLLTDFRQNFRQFENDAPPEVREAAL